MTCAHCTDLCQEFAIRTPAELDKVIRVIRENLKDKTLLEITQPASRNDAIEPTPFEEIVGARPDMIKCDFKCTTCGERFHLRCETYHGSGGGWSFGAND
jgi:hypothetical protein